MDLSVTDKGVSTELVVTDDDKIGTHCGAVEKRFA